MNFIVYSKDGCPYCDKVKMVLEHVCKNEQHSLTVYKLNSDFTRDQFYSEFGEGSTFPQVIVDGSHAGGCSDTVRYLQEKNLI